MEPSADELPVHVSLEYKYEELLLMVSRMSRITRIPRVYTGTPRRLRKLTASDTKSQTMCTRNAKPVADAHSVRLCLIRGFEHTRDCDALIATSREYTKASMNRE